MYMKQVSPYFKLYISPINIDPSQPALPLSTPASYSKELWKQVGFYYTQGIAEDTKALSDRVLTDGEYLEQARLVLAEQLRFFDVELAKLHGGMLFAYFSSLDQNAHMFWRAFDKNSPAYDPDVSEKYADTLEWFYQQMDQMLGKALAKADGDTTVIVMSDHGFAPYDRSFNLNTWLLGNGYIALKPGQRSKPGDLFTRCRLDAHARLWPGSQRPVSESARPGALGNRSARGRRRKRCRMKFATSCSPCAILLQAWRPSPALTGPRTSIRARAFATLQIWW